MESFKHIAIANFDYPLDDNRIAKYPLEQRASSKLLIYKDKRVSSSTFSLIRNEVTPGDLMVFNNTKVVQARLKFKKKSSAKIEIFLLNPVKPNEYQLAFSETNACQWNCIVGNIKRWKGEILLLPIEKLNVCLKAAMLARTDDGALVQFHWSDPSISFAQIIEHIGQVPIPPYLNREPEANDKQRYQTVYAKPEGSVAAPTAGLHFTRDILKELKDKDICFAEVTLHVGAGTFKPVKTDSIGNHDMHTERIYVTKKLLDEIINAKGEIIAVGTTSLRTLESIFWLGVKALNNKLMVSKSFIGQWDGYTVNSNYTVIEALNALKKFIESTGEEYLSANTQMIIVPGYKFRIVDKLITNFHQPRSTLLLLVAAFIGADWKRVYEYALENNYRFLSYGDSSILSRNELSSMF